MLDEITEQLQKSHKAEKEYHANKISQLRRDEDLIQSKINKLLDLHLEGLVTEDTYTTKQKALKDELSKLKVEKDILEGADDNFKQNLITAFKLTTQFEELFKSSKTSEKREIVNFIFTNLKLRGEKLEYTLRKPLDEMVNLGCCPKWLPIIDKLRTHAFDIRQFIEAGDRLSLVSVE